MPMRAKAKTEVITSGIQWMPDNCIWPADCARLEPPPLDRLGASSFRGTRTLGGIWLLIFGSITEQRPILHAAAALIV